MKRKPHVNVAQQPLRQARPARHQFPLTWADYNGGLAADEDLADHVRIRTVRAVQLG